MKSLSRLILESMQDHLDEKSVYAKNDISHTTKHRRLFHLTDNYGLGTSVDTNTLKSLRQDYISTTYRRETTNILGRHHYYYKLILDGKKLAETYGVFDYDHHVTEIGNNSRQSVSADEAEVGIDTREIDNLSDYLLGCVILSRPYTDHQILFLSDINRGEYGYSVENVGTIHAVTALNRLINSNVPLYWQKGNDFVPLSKQDHNYLFDIERLLKAVEQGKTRHQRHLDLVEKLLDKYDIKSSDYSGGESLDQQTIQRRRMITPMMTALNGYFSGKKPQQIDPNQTKSLMVKLLHMMKFGDNVIKTIIHIADEYMFFHPTVQPVEWTSVLRDLIDGKIDSAIESIKYSKPDKWKLERFAEKSPYEATYSATGMSGDED